jgi:hypothetical protein
MKLCTCMNSAFTLRATVPQKLSKSISRLVLSRLWPFRDTWSTQEHMITSSIQVGPKYPDCGFSGTHKAHRNPGGYPSIHVGTVQFVSLQGHLEVQRNTWGWSCLGCSSSDSLKNSGTHEEPGVYAMFSSKEPPKNVRSKSVLADESPNWGERRLPISLIVGSRFFEKPKQCKIESKKVNFEFRVMALWKSELFYFITYLQVVVILMDEIWPVRNNICPTAAGM